MFSADRASARRYGPRRFAHSALVEAIFQQNPDVFNGVRRGATSVFRRASPTRGTMSPELTDAEPHPVSF
jgi:hypothetical protein